METIRLDISGMHCDHCVAAVDRALCGVDGVSRCDVAIGSAMIELDTSIGRAAIVGAVRSAGAFEVTGFSKIEK